MLVVFVEIEEWSLSTSVVMLGVPMKNTTIFSLSHESYDPLGIENMYSAEVLPVSTQSDPGKSATL